LKKSEYKRKSAEQRHNVIPNLPIRNLRRELVQAGVASRLGIGKSAADL
jgi:hypothetical protein